LKAAVVRRDEFESHLRKALNLGHTIGHAIEASSAYGVPHGAAIAMGIAAESRIAARLGILAREDCERLFALMRLLRLPLQIPSHLNRKKFVTAFHADKKSVQHSSRFVLLNGIGRCVIGVPVQFELVAEVCGLRR
jgi:3-dehydroquinate synthase